MQIDRTERPSASGQISFEIPKIIDDKLTDELNLFYTVKKDLPIVRINLLVNSGSFFDPPHKSGLSNLLTMCIDEGAGKYNSLQLADEFEMLGAHFSVASDLDTTIVSMQVLKENFNQAIKLFASVITEPHLSEDDFNREKRKVIVRINQLKLKPDYVADISFEHFLFEKECPYSYPVSGFQKSVENIFHQDVREYYQQKFCPLNSVLIAVGDIDPKSLKEILSDEFGNWRTTPAINKPAFNLYNQKNKIFIINKPESVQTEIRIGQLSSKRSESDFFQKQIINLVFGGQFSSRLNLNLREKNGYTYGINSSFSYLKEAGYFKVSTSVAIEFTSNALKEIFSELKKIKDGISSDELDFAKSSITKRFPSNFETYRQIASNIIVKVFFNLSDDFFESYLQKVKFVTLDDVNNIAYKYFNNNELLTVLVGDSQKIIEQMDSDEFGEIEIIEFDSIFD